VDKWVLSAVTALLKDGANGAVLDVLQLDQLILIALVQHGQHDLDGLAGLLNGHCGNHGAQIVKARLGEVDEVIFVEERKYLRRAIMTSIQNVTNKETIMP